MRSFWKDGTRTLGEWFKEITRVYMTMYPTEVRGFLQIKNFLKIDLLLFSSIASRSAQYDIRQESRAMN